LKRSKASQLHALAAFQRVTHYLEKSLDHLLRLLFVKAYTVAQHLGQFGPRERRRLGGRSGVGSRDIPHHGTALRRKKVVKFTRSHWGHVEKRCDYHDR
jgi:hypothetical protein